jgi:cell division septal protein FtsQ
MPQRTVTRRRYQQARKLRRFENERPSVRAVVREGTAWTTVNVQRMPGLVVMVACVLIVGYLFLNPRFFVYEASVTGNTLLAAEPIYRAAGADSSSIFFLAPSVIEKRIVAQFPGLAEAKVALTLPGRMAIGVKERKVQYAWEAAGQTYLADERGVVLGSGQAPVDAYLIRTTEGTAPTQGQPLDVAVLETASGLSAQLGGQRSFVYTPKLGVGWRTEQGWTVYFGVGGDLAQKVAVMRTMATQLAQAGTKLQYLDVGTPSRPYYR